MICFQSQIAYNIVVIFFDLSALMRQKLRRQNAAICWLINMNKKNSNQISWLDFQLCDPISEWRLLLYFREYVYVTESCFSSLTIICEFNRTYYTWFFCLTLKIRQTKDEDWCVRRSVARFIPCPFKNQCLV